MRILSIGALALVMVVLLLGALPGVRAGSLDRSAAAPRALTSTLGQVPFAAGVVPLGAAPLRPAVATSAPTAPAARSAGEGALATPSVVASLILPNDSLLPGNPVQAVLQGATAAAYAANVHYYYVTGAASGNVLVVNPSSQRVLTSISVGGSPTSIAYDVNNHLLYVANAGTAGAGRLDVINPVTNTAGASILLGPASMYPSSVAYDPVTKYLYVADLGSHNLTVVDPLSAVVVGTVAVGSEPSGVAIAPSASRVYVTNFGSDNVSLVNATSFKVLGSIEVGSEPAGLDVAVASSQLYVANSNSSNVSVIDMTTATVARTVALAHGSTPVGILSDPARNTVWIGGVAGTFVEVVNATDSSLVTTPALSSFVNVFAYAPDRNEVGAVSASNYLVRVSDLSYGTLGAISLGSGPDLVVFDNATGDVYVSDAYTANVWVIDQQTDQLAATFVGPAPATAMTVSPDGSELLIGTNSTTRITVLNASTGATVRQVALGDPGGIGGFLFLGDQLFVSESRGAVAALNSTTYAPRSTFGVGGSPTEMIGDRSLGLAYLVNSNESNLTVFRNSTDSVVGTVNLSNPATGIAFQSSLGGHVFVSIGAASAVDTIVAGTSVVSTVVSVAGYPGPMTYNATLGSVLVSESGSDRVAILNATNFLYVGSIVTGAFPMGLDFSLYTGELYVAAPGNTGVSIVSMQPAGVIPPFAASSLAMPSTAEVGQPTTIVVSSTIRPWTLSFAYTNLPTGCVGSNSARISCTATQSGTYTVHVAVTGPLSQTVDTSFTLEILPRVSVVLSAAPAAITLGGQTTITAAIVNASGAAQVGWLSVPAGCSVTSPALSFACHPPAGGSLTVTAFVSDGLGAWSEANLTFKVNAVPQVATFAPSPPTVEVDSSVTFDATISGGTAPFTVVYSGLPPGCVGANSTTLTCAPTSTGSFEVSILVTDANGAVARGTTNLSVIAKPVTASFLGLPYLDWALIGVVIIIVVVALALLLRRRSAPGLPPTEPSSPPAAAGPSEVTYGAEDAAAPPPTPSPEAAPPAAPRSPPPAAPRAAPPTPPPPRPAPARVPPSSTPKVSSAAPARGPVAGSARAPIKCSSCGTMNEPWLTNCRWCKRSLGST
ncbi:MAG: YncE family protein [Thermoplasmata archaeon]